MMKFLQKKKNTKGFTLIELIVVIAIIAILIAVAIMRMGASTLSAKVSNHNQAVRSLISAAQLKYASQPKAMVKTPASGATALEGYFQGAIPQPIGTDGNPTGQFEVEISAAGDVVIYPGYAKLNDDGKSVTIAADSNTAP